jgi:hypothetical protein
VWIDYLRVSKTRRRFGGIASLNAGGWG